MLKIRKLAKIANIKEEVFGKNVTCDKMKSHKKSGLHTLPRKHSFRKTTQVVSN